MLDSYRSIPLTLDLANQYVPNTMVSSGLDARGRTFDLTITDNGKQADLTDAIVWMAWHHQQVGNSGIRKMEPVDASRGTFTCHLPTNMAHLGTVVAAIIVTNDGPDFFLPSLEFKIRIESAIFDGHEADTCDDFTALQEAMGNLRNVLNAAIEQMEDQAGLYQALMTAMEGWYREAEADRYDQYNQAEATRNQTFADNESTRQRTFDTNEANRQATFDTNEAARQQTFDDDEAARQKTFDDNEAERERIYLQEEGERQVAENRREAEENKRLTQERARQAKEAERIEAEAGRVAAETEREEFANQFKADVESGKYSGATYTPAVSLDGDLSWTNNQDLPNPPTVNIKGPKGDDGVCTNISGLFSLSVDEDGNLWCHYYDEDHPPVFDLDTDGNLYYITED